MNDNQTPKASYHPPTFSIYGNLADLTKNADNGPTDNPLPQGGTMSQM